MDFEKMVLLDLVHDEQSILQERFSNFMKEFSVLEKFDTDDIEPLDSVLDLFNIMRSDDSSRLISKDELLENAPESDGEYFVVPAAID